MGKGACVAVGPVSLPANAEDLYVAQGKGSYASPVQLFLPFCHMSQSHKASSKPDSVGFHIESLLSTIWG